MDIEALINDLRTKVDALGSTVNTLSVETSVLQELCAAMMAELAIQAENPSERLEQIIAEEQDVSYQVALDMDDDGDNMWDLLVSHAEIRARAFDHARMALARMLGTH